MMPNHSPFQMQFVLLLLALVSVPWMLIRKSLFLKIQHQQVCLYNIILSVTDDLRMQFTFIMTVFCISFQSDAPRSPVRYALGH